MSDTSYRYVNDSFESTNYHMPPNMIRHRTEDKPQNTEKPSEDSKKTDD